MPNCPKISLIIPVYNVQTYLEACLQSVAEQTFGELEVLLVDDGSTDQSASICKRFLENYPSWVYIRQPNQGVAVARQAGIRHATGEYFSFLDADDVLSPHYFSALWAAITRTGAPLAVAPMHRFVEHIQTATMPEGTFWADPCLDAKNRVRIFENFSAALALCGKLISRQLWDKATPSFPVLRTGDDILPSVELLCSADKIAVAGSAIYYYRQARPGSQSTAGPGRFGGLLEGFSLARAYLIKTGKYPHWATGFERVRFICLTSFIEKFGIRPEEETALRARRKEFKIPRFVCEGWPWKLRLRAWLLYGCLGVRVSYNKCIQCLRVLKR